MKQIFSELNLQDWAIITATEIIVSDRTYQQCVEIRENEELDPNEATIVTNACANRMLRNIVKGE